MKDITLYFVDSNIHLFYKKNKYTETLKDIIVDGRIVSKDRFIVAFNKILKKNKIKSKLFGDEVEIVKNVFYTEGDILYLEQIFSDLGFVKVHFWDIKELIPDEDATMVEINQNYIVFYFDKPIMFSLNYFKDIPKLFSLLNSFLKPVVILFGTNKNIPKIVYNLKSLYYYENYSTYITDSLLKVKKYDV